MATQSLAGSEFPAEPGNETVCNAYGFLSASERTNSLQLKLDHRHALDEIAGLAIILAGVDGPRSCCVCRWTDA